MAADVAELESNFRKRFAALQAKLAQAEEKAATAKAPDAGKAPESGSEAAKASPLRAANVDDIRQKLLAKAVASGRLPPGTAEAGVRRKSFLPPVSGEHGDEVRAAVEEAGLPADAATQLAQLAAARRAAKEQRMEELQKLAKQAEQLQTALAQGIPKVTEPPGVPDQPQLEAQADRLRQVWEAQQKVEADLQDLIRGSAEQMGKGKGKAFGKWPGKGAAAFASEQMAYQPVQNQASPGHPVARPSMARPGGTRPHMAGRQLAPSSFRSPAELQALAAAQGRPPAGQEPAQRQQPRASIEEPPASAAKSSAWQAAAEERPAEAPAEAPAETPAEADPESDSKHKMDKHRHQAARRRAESEVPVASTTARASAASVTAAPSAATHATSAALYPIDSEITHPSAEEPVPAVHAEDPSVTDHGDGTKTGKQTRFDAEPAEQRAIPSEEPPAEVVAKKPSRARKSWFGGGGR